MPSQARVIDHSSKAVPKSKRTAPRKTADANKVVPLVQTSVAVIEFAQLVVGDRFQPAYATGPDHPVYTKSRHDQARCHSVESINLKKEGFGYLEDPIVAVANNEKVTFLPVTFG